MKTAAEIDSDVEDLRISLNRRVLRRAKSPVFDEEGRTVIEHEDIDKQSPSKFFGVMVINHQDPRTGKIVSQEQQQFPIEAENIYAAFFNFDDGFKAHQSKLTEQTRKIQIASAGVALPPIRG